MDQKTPLEPIPTPPGKPIIGNMLTIDKDAPLQSLMQWSREMGPIFKMDMMGTPLVVASGAEIVEELCDESRFDKAVRGSLRRVRSIGGDGLFTGDTQEPNWSKAHNILLPTFSRQAMSNYLPMMLDVAKQLCLKWERLNADDEIDVVHDMTAVALDTIGICGFNYRFNSFYRRDYHPFIDALTRTLETAMMQRGLPFEKQFLRDRLNQLGDDVDFMNTLVDDIIRERRRGADADQNDLLNYMLAGVDKVTGESLSDENIRYQINTFLIAGHETTSGLMSFTLYFLLNHPDVLEKAYEEVDRVLGRDLSSEPTLKQVNQLEYVQMVILEALRLWPTAPAIGLYPYEDEIVGGKYKLKKNTFVTMLTLMLHRDKSVWGENAEDFNPENFSKEAVAGRPIHAYKPFGNGQRACIGRQFALQEAVLVIGMILQRFQLFDHKKYELVIKESLSIKPDGFTMKVKLRPDAVRSRLVPGGMGAGTEEKASLANTAKRPSHGTQALILYGSNLGSTEEIAREIALSADTNGFETKIAELDQYADNLPKSGMVVIACASYNGAPPDNAAEFVRWLESAESGACDGVNYAVFGCGHSDWAATFQATPRLVDDRLSALGANRIGELGEGDAKEDIDGQFQDWFADLWTEVGKTLEIDVDFSSQAASEPLYQVEVLEKGTSNPLITQTNAQRVKILKNSELQNREGKNASERSTRHIEVELPSDLNYRCGDHLAVVPKNSLELCRRVEQRFGFDGGSHIQLSAKSQEHAQLPIEAPISVRVLLQDFVELQSVATRKDVATLVSFTECPHSKSALEKLAGDDYREAVFTKRLSILELLEQFPACELPFGAFLEMSPMLAVRYYSISSSPRTQPKQCSITVGVVDEPAISGNGKFKGVCSNYLAGIAPDGSVHVSVRKTKDEFCLPDDPAKPVIMIGPGTGIAPFRGFLQERAALKKEGEKLGEAILFFGCRHPEQDFLYKWELEQFEKDGIVQLLTAFSRKTKTKTYVQDVLRKQRDKVWKLIEAGANIYVCGDGSRMEPDVRRALALIYSEEKDVSAEAADAWINEMAAQGRYNLDVWVSN